MMPLDTGFIRGPSVFNLYRNNPSLGLFPSLEAVRLIEAIARLPQLHGEYPVLSLDHTIS